MRTTSRLGLFLLLAGLLLWLPQQLLAAAIHSLQVAPAAPSQAALLIFALLKVLVSAGVGLIGTELTKIQLWVQNRGAIAVAIVGVVWGAAAGYISGFAHTPVPGDFTQLTAAGVGAIIVGVFAALFHIQTVAPALRAKRLGSAFRF